MKGKFIHRLRNTSPLPKVVILWLGVYLLVKYVIHPPLPASLVFMYLALASVAIILYVSIYEEVKEATLRPIREFLRGHRGKSGLVRVSRIVVLVLIPLLAGKVVYQRLAPTNAPPAEQRVVHPAPPTEYVGLVNPIPHTPENLLVGKGLFAAYCSPCHGSKLDGHGPQAAGFNPPPANFTDSGTIAQLQESFLFWRISKGGVGLPIESQPWNSAMPRWETRISPENIWKIIMWEYKGAGKSPRTWE